jgi:FKBP-type peptidyl-prolyl cis-trans isomerase FklB
MARGLRDGLAGDKLLVSEEDLRNALATFQGELKQKQLAAQTVAEESKKRGDVFLAENAKTEGVVTLPSGLQYKVVSAAEGRKPTDRDVVRCHYRSMRTDGTEFDNSYTRGQPATFPVARALPGWKEALKLMTVGSKWTLYVPSALAFGQRGLHPKKGGPATIAANTAVVFDLELLAINPGKGAGAQTAADVAPDSARGD